MLELERNQPEAALPYARSSVRLEPQNAQGRTAYAMSLLGVGQSTASIPHWNMAIEALPQDFSLLAGLLEAYAQSRDYEGALATALVLSRRSPVRKSMSGSDGALSNWVITKPAKPPTNKPRCWIPTARPLGTALEFWR